MSSKNSSKAKSINLYPQKDGKPTESDNEDDENVDAEHIVAEENARKEKEMRFYKDDSSKSKMIAKFIKASSSLVSYEVEQNVLDHGDMCITKKYHALPECEHNVVALKSMLQDSNEKDRRPLTLLLHKYQVLPSQILPLLTISINEGRAVRLCLRVISQIMVPMTAKTMEVLRTGIAADKKAAETLDERDARVGSAKTEKANALEQMTALLAFKEALVTGTTPLFTSICSVLAAPLRKPESERTPGDHSIMETVVHVLSNLSNTHTVGNAVSIAQRVHARELQCHLITQLEGTLLNIIINFCENIATAVFKDNLNFFIDLIASMFRGYDARELYKHRCSSGSVRVSTATVAQTGGQPAKSSNAPLPRPVLKGASGAPRSSGAPTTTSNVGSGLVSSILRQKNNRLQQLHQKSQRHSRFGGLYTVGNNGPPPAPATSNGAAQAPASSIYTTPASRTNGNSNQNVPNAGEEMEIEEEKDDGKPSARPHQILIQNPFQAVADNIHQTQARNVKRYTPFITDSCSAAAALTDDDEEYLKHLQMAMPTELLHRTASVLVTFLDKFSSKGFEKLVHCVKEDLRRDEHRVGFGYEELEYFRIISVTLRYHRLKVLDSKARADSARAMTAMPTDSGTPHAPWVPNIRCMMAALDRMSFRRVLGAINRLVTKDKALDSVVIPLETYKEMLCYIHVMLQSSNPSHHELAIAALFPLFYTVPAERLDPLTFLLRSWKNGSYRRKHAHLLVELVHETMKTLEAAKTCFKARNATDKKGAGSSTSEAEIERYITACLRFSEAEYFERLVNNHTVRFYTTLVADYRNSSPTIHHYLYCFLQRMYSHKVESDRYGVLSSADSSTSAGDSSSAVATSSPTVTLGHLLFNIQTLQAIYTVVSSDAARSKMDTPLIRLLLCIVRSFATLAAKNRLLYVEALFPHPHPVDFAFQLATVYDAENTAKAYRSATADEEGGAASSLQGTSGAFGGERDKNKGNKGKDKAKTKGTGKTMFGDDESEEELMHSGDSSDSDHKGATSSSSSSSEGEAGDRSKRKGEKKGKRLRRLVKNSKASISDSSSDDDELIRSAPMHPNAPAPTGALARRLSNAARRAKRSTRPAASAHKGGAGSDSSGDSGAASDGSGAAKTKRRRRGDGAVTKKRSGTSVWTAEDDELIRKQHEIYEGSASCFDTIASHEQLGGRFNAIQIKRRLRTLRMKRLTTTEQAAKAEDSEEDEDVADEEAEEEEQATQPQYSAAEQAEDEEDEHFREGGRSRLIPTPYSTDGEGGGAAMGDSDDNDDSNGDNAGDSAAGKAFWETDDAANPAPARRSLQRRGGGGAGAMDTNDDDDDELIVDSSAGAGTVGTTQETGSGGAGTNAGSSRRRVLDDDDD